MPSKKAAAPKKTPRKPPKKAAPPTKKPAAKKAPAPKPAGERHRLVLPMALYEPRKDEIKAPLKERGLKWQFLGEGKGRYHKEGVNLFAQFTDAGVDYTLRGEDAATVAAILAAWRGVLGDAAFAEALAAGDKTGAKEETVRESEETRLWKLQEPQRRPGEPDFFFEKRRAEWLAKKPTGGA